MHVETCIFKLYESAKGAFLCLFTFFIDNIDIFSDMLYHSLKIMEVRLW